MLKIVRKDILMERYPQRTYWPTVDWKEASPQEADIKALVPDFILPAVHRKATRAVRDKWPNLVRD